jgi:hypothetical protein
MALSAQWVALYRILRGPVVALGGCELGSKLLSSVEADEKSPACPLAVAERQTLRASPETEGRPTVVFDVAWRCAPAGEANLGRAVRTN